MPAAKYELREAESPDYRWRTRQNVNDSDATLILDIGALDGGTLETEKFAKSFGKPHLILLLDGGVRNEDVQQLLDWLQRVSIGALNIAGPRESKRPGILLSPANSSIAPQKRSASSANGTYLRQ